MISVGIDVSKEKSTICVLKPYGEIAIKVAGVHGRHGVVEKKQSGVRNKVWIGKRMVLLRGCVV